MTQRKKRVDATRSLSWNETRDQRHGREECRQAAKRDRIRGLDVEEHGLQESRQHQRAGQPPGRGRRTKIEFINLYVVNMARQFQLDAPINAAIIETVHVITSGRLPPNPGLLVQVLQARTRK